MLRSIEKTENLAKTLHNFFRLWPSFNLGDGLVAITSAFWEQNLLGIDSCAFDWDVAGCPLVALFASILPYFGLLLFLEGYLDHIQQTITLEWERFVIDWYSVKMEHDGMPIQNDGLNVLQMLDGDIRKDKKFVSKKFVQLVHSAPIVFLNVWKVYLTPTSGLCGLVSIFIFRSLYNLGCALLLKERAGQEVPDEDRWLLPKRAVQGLSFAVRKGEAFVLLGVNDSGKSTVLGLLSGVIRPTCGSVFVEGNIVSSTMGASPARRAIGVCPQSDPLLEHMTGRETLCMYARLHGIPKAQVDMYVGNLLKLLTLYPLADKSTEEYSGGNKRKLALGIAIVGDPDVLLIDECCSGVDLASQRKIWNLVNCIAKDRSMVLTTHSMDEAQALSSRAAIMVDGKLLCLGSVQHLKVSQQFMVEWLLCHTRHHLELIDVSL